MSEAESMGGGPSGSGSGAVGTGRSVRRWINTSVGSAILLIVFSILLLSSDLYAISVLTQGLLYACLALGLNVVIGFTGLLDIGYAGFLAFGGYTWAIAATEFEWNVIEAIPLVVFMAFVGAMIIALPTLRLQGDYLAIVTLAFGVAVGVMANNLEITGGASGIYGIPPLSVGGLSLSSPKSIAFGFAVTLVAFMLFTAWLRRSRFGLHMMAVRDDEGAAAGMGVRPFRIKTAAYLIGCILASIVGVEYASSLTAVSPSTFSLNVSVFVLLAVILGGQGGVVGPVLGGFVVALVPELLRDYDNFRFLFFGFAIVAMVLLKPSGLLPPSPSRTRALHGAAGTHGLDSEIVIKSSDRVGRARAEVGGSPEYASLKVTGLTVTYGGVHAVNDVSFEIPGDRAVVLGIIGPNGAGKTSVINAISGFTKASGGSVQLDGLDIASRTSSAISRLGIRRTFQNVRLFSELTVADNIRVGAPRELSHESLEGLFGAVGLPWEVAEALPRALPYGLQKRVEIARALSGEPRLILLDEPGAGLNDAEKLIISDVIRTIRSAGIQCIVIDHDVQLMVEISDSLICLDQGQVLATGSPSEVVARTEVVDAYLGSWQ